MTLNELITKLTGKKCCLGGLCQCVALARQYIQDVLGLPQFPTVAGAYQIFDVASDKDYTKIKTGVPKPGDIIIWKKEYGGVGHVAIVVEADVNGVLSFDQNYTGHLDPCQLVNHSYNLVLGWLRSKGDNMVSQATCQSRLDRLYACRKEKARIIAQSEDRLKRLTKCREDFVKASKVAEQKYNEMVKIKDEDIKEANAEIVDWKMKALEGLTWEKWWTFIVEKIRGIWQK